MRRIWLGLIGALLAWPAAAQNPGTLLGSTPLAGAPAGAKAFRIRYASTDEQGRPVTITGMAVVPAGRAPAGGRDMVSWAHGSYGVAEKCAPLKGALQFSTIAGLEDMLARGYVVAATDYQGLGNPGPHPYLVGKASAQAVLDAARAAGSLPRAKSSGRLVVWGESQGAHAALWVGKIAPSYAPELRLVGVAAAAPPTDLKANLTGGTNALVRALLTAFTTDSWSKVYDAPMSAFARPATQRLIGRLSANNCITLDGFRTLTKLGLLSLSQQLRGVDISEPQPWRELIARNSVTPAGLTMPLFIAQEAADPVVAASVTRAFVEKLCRRPATRLRFVALEGGDHVNVGKRSADEAVGWMADRFAGRRAPSDCGRLG